MVDLHKEIKFSDLIPKRAARKPGSSTFEPAKRRQLPAEIVGLKIEAGSIDAPPRSSTTAARSSFASPRPRLPRAWSTAARCATRRGSRPPSTSSFRPTRCRGRACGSGSPTPGSPCARSRSAARRTASQLANAVGFRAHEIISSSLDNAVLDYHVLGTSVDDDGQTTHRVLLVIAYRDSVDRYLAATDAANLELVGIDLDAFAILRASIHPRAEEPDPEAAIVAVSIDNDLTTLAISDGSICRFTRVLEWGTGNVDLALVRALKVPAAQAEEIRRDPRSSSSRKPPGTHSRAGRSRRTSSGASCRHSCASCSRRSASTARSRERHRFAASSSRDRSSTCPGSRSGSASDLSMPVSPADPFSRVELGPDVTRPERSDGLVVAVGLGIED